MRQTMLACKKISQFCLLFLFTSGVPVNVDFWASIHSRRTRNQNGFETYRLSLDFEQNIGC